jgi:hypothetical protein
MILANDNNLKPQKVEVTNFNEMNGENLNREKSSLNL